MYQLIRPNRGWVRILWRDGAQHSLEVSLALSLVDLVPGCQVGEMFVEIPHTAWTIDEVVQLLEAMGLDPVDILGDFGGSAPSWQLWEPARPLYHHQVQAALEMSLMRSFLLADEMGIGKTATAIVAAQTIREQHDFERPGVIIAPLFTRDTWKRELHVLGALTNPWTFCSLATRNLNDKSFRANGVDWYFVHYDIVRAWWSKITGLQHKPVVAIVDEAHHIRNSRTQRAKGTLMVAGQADYRFLLTGTPMEGKPGDLWNLLTVATGARTWGGPLAFRKRYAGAEFNGFGWQDTEPTNTAELQERMEPYYMRRTAKSVGLDLPELTRSTQLCDMRHFQREHDEVLGSAGAEQIIRAVVSGAVRAVLPVLTRLRKLTSAAKYKSTLEYVDNLVEQGESVVVFCWERKMAKAFYDNTWAAESYLATGEQEQSVRDFAVNSFQQDGGVMCATYGALKEGVTLHRARIVVLHDLDWTLSAMLQAEKRIHRIGQKRGCQSVWMVADHSIDTLLLPVLHQKAGAMQAVLGMDEGSEALEALGLVPEDQVEIEVQSALRAWEAM